MHAKLRIFFINFRQQVLDIIYLLFTFRHCFLLFTILSLLLLFNQLASVVGIISSLPCPNGDMFERWHYRHIIKLDPRSIIEVSIGLIILTIAHSDEAVVVTSVYRAAVAEDCMQVVHVGHLVADKVLLLGLLGGIWL